jgi:hypothetical protein
MVLAFVALWQMGKADCYGRGDVLGLQTGEIGASDLSVASKYFVGNGDKRDHYLSSIDFSVGGESQFIQTTYLSEQASPSQFE